MHVHRKVIRFLPRSLRQIVLCTLRHTPVWDSFIRWYHWTITDAYLVSFPKCGRTWLRLIVGRAIQQHFGFDAERTKMLDLTPLARLHPGVPRIEVTHEGTPHLQTPEELNTSKSRYAFKKVVLLVRDPRDVVVSLYYQRCKRDETYDGALRDFIYESRGSLDTIIEYYNIWASRRDVPGELLLVRYEDLHEATVVEARRVLDFLGLYDVDTSIVKHAVEYASFDNMRKMERSGQVESERLQPGDPTDKQSYKTRKGQVGGFREELDEPEIEYVTHRLTEELAPVFGYV